MGSFTGIYANLFLAGMINKINFLSSFFAYIGKRGISIMALNYTAFKAVTLVYILYHQAPLEDLARFPVITWKHYWWAAYLAGGLAIPVLIDFLWDNSISLCKIPIRNYKKKAELKP